MNEYTVLLDADGTLFDFARSEREAIAETLEAIGTEPVAPIVRRYSQINESLWKQLERGEIQKSVLFYRRFECLFAEFDIHASAHDAAELYMQSLSKKGYLLDGAENFCRNLSEVARLYIVTNGTERIQQGRFAKSGLRPYFQDVFISDRIGYEKPHAEYFAYVETHISNFDRSKTLLVGDSLTSDICGGIQAGIPVCWYNPEGKEIPDFAKEKLVLDARNFDEIYRWIAKGERL